MTLRPLLPVAIATGAALLAAVNVFPRHPSSARSSVFRATFWQHMASPGALSRPHAFLEYDCAACHTSVKGVESSKCIACHASNEAILQRQPTAFHDGIGHCRACHREHQGVAQNPTDMDHATVAVIGLRQLQGRQASPGGNDSFRDQLLAWVERNASQDRLPSLNPDITASEAVLNCVACHANEDRHVRMFGQDCAQCHSTRAWAIPTFRHPSPRSTNCVQCHQAPPSHYMGHFHMISRKVAGKPHAEVRDCYQCHQTTSWNDIREVGWYKHH